MAKVKISDYVLTLKSLVAESQSDQELSENFTGFLQLLRQNRQLDLIEQILADFERQLYHEQGKLLAVVHSSDRPRESQLTAVASFLCSRFQVKDVIWRVQTDLSSPGLVVEANGERFDWSLAGQLERFKTSIQAA